MEPKCEETNPGGDGFDQGGNAAVKNETKTNKKSESIHRNKHACPFPSCVASVVHLPRHMKQVHKWSASDASQVVNVFGLRKDKKLSSKKPRNFKSMFCPVGNCQTVVKRLHNHLTDVHNLKRGTEKYKNFLASAVQHEVVVISSCSESACDSSSSEDQEIIPSKKRCKTSKGKEKGEQKPSIFKQIYPSSEGDSSEDDYPNQRYPAIFKMEEKNDEGEVLQNQPSTSNEYPSSSFQSHDNPDHGTSEDQFSDIEDVESDESYRDCESDASPDEEVNVEIEEDCAEVIKKPQSKEQKKLFEAFQTWLKGPDGGRRDEACAIQCVRQVQLVMQYIDKENPTLSNILHKHTLRDKWLSKFEIVRRPGTVGSYLSALQQFYVFLKCEKPKGINVSSEVLSCSAAQMTQWRKSGHKLIKDRFWEKRMDDMAKLKTPQQIKEFDVSSVARTAVKVLGDFQDKPSGTMPSQSEYTGVRDYLLTLICINNGSRSGALANMTLAEFRKAQEEDGCFVVKVRKHKTFTTHGPAHLVLSASLHHWMELFISRFRNTVGGVNTDDAAPVFLTWTNKPMHPSHVGCQIGSCWGKVFGKEAGAGGATAFRKAAVSAVHKHDKGRREDLAGLMVHNKSTADRYYLMQEKAKSAVQTSKYLTNIMHKCDSTEIADSSEIACDSKVDSNKIQTTTCSSISSSRRKWLPKEEAALKSLFTTNIAKKAITMEDVRKVISDHPLLSDIPASKVRDKIRTFFKDVIPVLPSLPPDETPQQRLKRTGIETCTAAKQKDNDGSEYSPSLVSPSTCHSRKSKQNLFKDDDEREVFKATFKDLIETKKTISKAYVKQKLEAEPKLGHLLDNYTLLQLADKVRTERKIHIRDAKLK